MGKWKQPVQIVLLFILTYFLLRLIFFTLYFSKASIENIELLKIFVFGSRLDLAVIVLINIPFILLYRYSKSYIPETTRTASFIGILILLNLPFLLVNFIDIIYYPFNLRRSTIDVIKISGDMKKSTMVTFFFRYWKLSIPALLVTIVLFYLLLKILQNGKDTRPHAIRMILADLPVWILIFFLVRGTGNRPLMPSTALIYFPSQYQELANNSSLTLLYSTVKTQTKLRPLNYFEDQTADSIYQISRRYPADSFRNKNVVIFIMESFSKRYLDKNDPLKTHTPFLDSIINESIYCENAYSTSFESNKGLVSILLGVPSFLDEPLYYSPYANARYQGLGHHLSEKNYHTSFFMGCEFDNFGFAKAAKMAGIDHYYSTETYGSDEPHDGTWGIFDSYFFPYFLKEIDSFKEPFYTTIFNLSTHDPFNLPPEAKQQFDIKGQSPAQNAVSYLDHVLAEFFKQASQRPWFRNTVFVFTADHASPFTADLRTPVYMQSAIPIIYYEPGKAGRKENRLTTQSDIVPTLHDMLGTGASFLAFGKSINDTTKRLVVSRRNYYYESMDNDWILGYNDNTDKPIYFFNYRSDPSLKNNILHDPKSRASLDRMMKLTRAYLQQYNNRLISKELMPGEKGASLQAN
jgi:phosphoglycerol transferase MdoB-like AlkP superfamily enzyme